MTRASPAPSDPAPGGDAAFCARAVALQLGAFQGPLAQSETAFLQSMRTASGSAAGWQRATEVPVRAVAPGQDPAVIPDAAIWDSEKAGGALREILSHGPEFGFVVDMQDRRQRPVAAKGEHAVPVFAFNRVAGDPHRVLWPLPRYHALDGDQFLSDVDPEAVAWSDKQARVVWRGITGGRVRLENGHEGYRLKALLKQMHAGRVAPEDAQRLMHRLPRYGVLARHADDPRFDLGFVDGDGYVIARTPFHAALGRPRMTRRDMQRCKYIAVLRGLDVGSSFYWVMNSGSLGFVQDTPFETFASGFFQPWQHYVPIREDGSDLVEKFDWAEANPDACRDMVARAVSVCRYLARPDLRERVLAEVIARLNAMPRG